MPNSSLSKLRRLQAQAQALLEEREEVLRSEPRLPRGRAFVQFLVRVYRGFLRNRCFMHAGALAYTTVLALVPLLAIALSISTALLKQEGEGPIRDLMDKAISQMAPMLDLQTADEESAAVERERLVREISEYIDQFNSGTLGVSAVLLFVFVAISLLSTVESTFNDIWGVSQGRSWAMQILAYWLVISLGPLLLVAAVGITGASQVRAAQEFIGQFELLQKLMQSFIVPCLILTLIFTALFAMMPNTKVDLTAAAVGGAVAGILLQANSLLSVMYVTRVISYHKIYGSMSALPLFLGGVYLSWLIVLLGAQVAYAFQNRRTYAQIRIAERVNQRGREFIALRIMTLVALRFQAGQAPATATELAEGLGVPLRLVSQVLGSLTASRLLVAVAGEEHGFYPARPLDAITAYDIIDAIRSGQGQELETSDDPSRPLVREEFEAIYSAERKVGTAVTLRQLVEKLVRQTGR